MKFYSILFVCAVLLGSCTNTSEPASNGTDSGLLAASEGPREMCFQLLEGTASQDTTSVRLILDGEQVTGDMAHYPDQKDSRVGSIRASINGDLISGMWTFMQEGITDSLPVEFRLSGDRLLQKSYSVNQETGREELKEDTSFDREFVKVNCGMK